MPPGRRTHDFPHGRPRLLSLTDTGFASLLALCALMFARNGRGIVVLGVAIFIAYAVARSLLLTRYERTGEAVPLNRISVVVKYPSGFPKAMLAARLAFFVVVAVMLAFGIVPLPSDTARRGIIGCVFGLIGVAVLNLILEARYVREGKAIEIEHTTK